MSDSRRLALELHEIRQLALAHATSPQFGHASVDGGGLSFRDRDGNEIGRIGGDDGLELEYVYGPKPPKPSTPIVVADANLLRVEWDGLFGDTEGAADSGVIAPPTLDRVEIHASMDENFVPDRVMSFAGNLPAADEGGAATVGPLSEAGDYYVVLLARGKDGQYSAPSERVHVVTTVGLMENELFDLALRADEARESADGKNTVHYGEEPVPPEGGFSDGDLWFDTTEDPETGYRRNMPHIWDPDADDGEGRWVSAEDSRVQTIQDAVDDLDEAVRNIEVSAGGATTYWWDTAPDDSFDPPPKDGDTWFRTSSSDITGHFEMVGGVWVEHKITDEVIANLHAGKITSGYLDAARIAAGTITADKMLIGGSENLIPMSGVDSGAGVAPHEAVGGRTIELLSNHQAGREYSNAIWMRGQDDGRVDAWDDSVTFNSGGLSGEIHNGKAFPVKVGQTFRADGYLMRRGSEPHGRVFARMTIVWYDFEGNSLVRSAGDGEGGVYTPDSQIFVEATAPESSAYMRIYVQTDRPGDIVLWRTRLLEQKGTVFIEDGAIVAEKIAAGTITAESGIIGSLDAGVITTGELRGELIRAQSIAGESLAVDAIDGKTITGATIRTSSAGQRVDMNTDGLFVRNSFGIATVRLANGTIEADGGTITGGTVRTSGSGARVEMNAGGLHAWNPDGDETFTLESDTGSVSMNGNFYSRINPADSRVVIDNTLVSAMIRDEVGGAYREESYAGILVGTETSGGLIYANDQAVGVGSRSMRIVGPGGHSRLMLNANDTRAAYELKADRPGSEPARLYADIYEDSGQALLGMQVGNTIQNPYNGSYANVRVAASSGDSFAEMISDGGRDVGDPRRRTVVSLDEGVLNLWADSQFSWLTPRIEWTNAPSVSGGTSLTILSNGRIGKASSSRRYKIAEEPLAHTDARFYDRLLGLQPKTWFDRAEAEYHAEVVESRNAGVGFNPEWVNAGPLRRQVGAIAEDLDEAGLGMLVSYTTDGEPESIMYDRIGATLIPVVRDLRDRVEELEKKMGEMADA